MSKEYKCPGKDLAGLVNALAVFERFDKEPKTTSEGRTIWAGDKTIDKFHEDIGIGPDIKYKSLVGDYVKRQNLLSQLHEYGDTKEDIFEHIRTHVSGCYDCSIAYLDTLTEAAKGLIKMLNKRKHLKASKKGFFDILRELDKKYLSLLKD